MTHLDKKIDAAKSSAHAYKVARDMAVANYHRGDKSAAKRAAGFQKKVSHYNRLVENYERREVQEKRMRA